MNEGASRRMQDPTADSALLLQRIGFFTLGIALPVSAMLSRRAAVVLVPIGVALIVIAGLLLDPDRFVRTLKRRLLSTPVLLLLLFVVWTGLSTIWGARGAQASERIVNLGLAVVLGVIGTIALSERTRAANLYAVSVGIGVAAALALGTEFSPVMLASAEDEGVLRTRGLAFALILSAPMCGWLLLRGRTQAAFAIIALVTAAILAVGSPELIFATSIAVAVFTLVLFKGGKGVVLVAWCAFALILLSPLAAMVGPRLLEPWIGAESVASLRYWADAIHASPAKIITGHGFGTVLAQVRAGTMPGETPVSVLFEIWHELGLVGAVTFSVVVLIAIRAVLPLPTMIQAGAVAAFIAALVLGVLGLANFRAWWLMTFTACIVLTTAIARGQARSDRPLARFVQARAEAPAAAAASSPANQAATGG